MPRRFVFAVAVLTCAAVPAFAQPATDFTYAASAQYDVCLDGRETRTGEQLLAACQTADQALGQLQTQYAGAPVEEQDYVWLMRGGVFLTIANAYLTIDGVRSARVCEASEQAWRGLGNISPTVSYRDAVAQSEETTIAVIRLCRSEQGIPTWARALP